MRQERKETMEIPSYAEEKVGRPSLLPPFSTSFETFAVAKLTRENKNIGTYSQLGSVT